MVRNVFLRMTQTAEKAKEKDDIWLHKKFKAP